MSQIMKLIYNYINEEEKDQALGLLKEIVDDQKLITRDTIYNFHSICEIIKKCLEYSEEKLENKFNALILSITLLQKQENIFIQDYFAIITFQSVVNIAKQDSVSLINTNTLKSSLIHYAREIIRVCAHMFPQSLQQTNEQPSIYLITFIQLKFSNSILFYKDTYEKEQMKNLTNPNYQYFKQKVIQDYLLNNTILMSENNQNQSLCQSNSSISQLKLAEIKEFQEQLKSIQLQQNSLLQIVKNPSMYIDPPSNLQYSTDEEIEVENQLKNFIEQLQFKLKCLEIQYKVCEEELIQYKKISENGQQLISQLQVNQSSESKKLKARIKSQDEELNNKNIKIQQLIEENQQLHKAQQQQIKCEIKSNTMDFDSLNSQLQLKSQQIIELENQKLQLKVQNDQLEQKNSILNQQLQQLEQKFQNNIKKQSIQQQQQVGATLDQYKYLKQQYEITKNELKYEKQQYEQDQIKKLSQLNSTIEDHCKTIKEQLNEIIKLQQQFQQQQKEKQYLEKQNSHLQKENSQLNDKLQQLEKQTIQFQNYNTERQEIKQFIPSWQRINSEKQITLNQQNNIQNYKVTQSQNFNLQCKSFQQKPQQ